MTHSSPSAFNAAGAPPAEGGEYINTTSAWLAAELERYHQAHVAGHLGAAPSALLFCRDYKLPIPMWVARHCYLHIVSQGKAGKRFGRTGGVVGQARQQVVAHLRWDTVIRLRELQGLLRVWIERYGDVVPPRRLARWRASRARLGQSWERVFICAPVLLRGAAAHGSPATIQESYERVKNAYRSDEVDPLVWLPAGPFLEDLGLMEMVGLRDQKLNELFPPVFG